MANASELAGITATSVDLAAGEMAVLERPGEGAPLVLLHALSSGAASWQRVIAALPAGPRVIAPDLRGHGGTRIPGGGGLDAHVEDLEGLLDALDALDAPGAALCGHSFGAVVAVAAARARSQAVAGLVLVDGGTRPPDSALAAAQNAIGRAEARWEEPRQFLEQLRESYAWEHAWSPALAAELGAELCQVEDGWATGADPTVIAADIEAMAAFSDAERPSSCPITVLRAGGGVLGGDDLVLGARELTLLSDGWGVSPRTLPDARHSSILYTHAQDVAAACAAAIGATKKTGEGGADA